MEARNISAELEQDWILSSKAIPDTPGKRDVHAGWAHVYSEVMGSHQSFLFSKLRDFQDFIPFCREDAKITGSFFTAVVWKTDGARGTESRGFWIESVQANTTVGTWPRAPSLLQS